MALLDIVLYPNPILSIRAKEVTEVNDEIRKLIDDMTETMYDAFGIGLAAPQVNQSLRICLVDIANAKEEEPADLHVCINPVIVEKSGTIDWEEGCLSTPELFRTVTRPKHIIVEALNRDGQPFIIEAEGILSVCLQHEIDHLDGIMFMEHLSPLKRKMALKTWRRLRTRIERENKKDQKKIPNNKERKIQ